MSLTLQAKVNTKQNKSTVEMKVSLDFCIPREMPAAHPSGRSSTKDSSAPADTSVDQDEGSSTVRSRVVG